MAFRKVAAFLLVVFTSQVAFADVEFKSEPALIENPSGRVPLAAVVRFSTNDVVDVVIEVSDGESVRTTSFEGGTDVDGAYSVPVLGMRPGRRHTIS